jgi:hypothetical protein
MQVFPSILKYSGYGFLAFVTWKLMKREKEDMWYIKVNGKSVYKGDGHSKNYVHGKCTEGDSVDKIIDKIEWLSHCDTRTVKWRRFMLMSIVILTVLLFFVVKRYLSAQELLLSVFLIYFVLYSFYSFYNYHYSRYPEYLTRENICLLRCKLGLNKKMSELFGILDA